MNKVLRDVAFVLTSVLALFSTTNINAVTVTPSDYIIAGNIGDTWTYQDQDSALFTWTLSQIATGIHAGRFKRGNDDKGMIYDMTGTDLNIHQFDFDPDPPVVINPPWVIGDIELGEVVTLNDDPVNPSMFLFWDVPSVTVQAGTFTDVLAWVWLDGNPIYSPNLANTQLGLPSSVTAAVTDINFFARGVGEVAYLGIDAGTGLNDGFGYELVATTVPVPAAVWLFGSGLIGLIGVARRKASA